MKTRDYADDYFSRGLAAQQYEAPFSKFQQLVVHNWCHLQFCDFQSQLVNILFLLSMMKIGCQFVETIKKQMFS